MKLFCAVLAACLSGAPSLAAAQGKAVDLYSPQQLMSMVPPLRAQADKSGDFAAKVLERYPGHYTVLIFRDRNGRAELHKKFVDIFVVLDGHGTLVSGGDVIHPKPSGTVASGEIQGDGIQGGTREQLAKGDIVHIPANLPHQILVPSGDSITYLVVKVQQ